MDKNVLDKLEEVVKEIHELKSELENIRMYEELPDYIQKKNMHKIIDSVCFNTLQVYEKNGLKRIQPTRGGNVFYAKEDIINFMNGKKVM